MSKDKYGMAVRLTLSVSEVIGLCCMLKVGRMFTQPEHAKQVRDVMDRLAAKLKAAGIPESDVNTLVRL